MKDKKCWNSKYIHRALDLSLKNADLYRIQCTFHCGSPFVF